MATLVIMAAGLGSRYKGLKQIDEVGPTGEVLMDYSIADAKKSGFNKFVIIVSADFIELCQDKMLRRWGPSTEILFAIQKLEDIPSEFKASSDRKKPWGTGHALLTVQELVKEPFALINADDFYGAEAFEQMYKFLDSLDSSSCHAGLVGYKLENTVSPYGSVSRGVCKISSETHLDSIEERQKIFTENDKYFWIDDCEESHPLRGDEVVSMNFWGFCPSVFYDVQAEFTKFLSENQNHLKKEFLIPEVVNNLVKRRKLVVNIIPTKAQWFGMTYPEDKPKVIEHLRNLN